jgi:hypothetical protein
LTLKMQYCAVTVAGPSGFGNTRWGVSFPCT